MDSTTLNINGIQFDLDLLDADMLEKFQDLTSTVSQQANKIQEETDKKEADKMRELCKTVDDFYDGLFGEGTAESLFETKTNLRERISAFNDTMNYARQSSQETADLFSKYAPQRLNRAQRRAQQFNKNSTASARQRTVNMPESADDEMTIEQAKKIIRLAGEHGKITDGEQS